ncbi:hypothetical protein [Embleya sp. AB8]|uniref:hypothetical protein n=1 Tax=Embleya sp. AB8 TaxID=3156304 RepID=UPI003C744287
MASGTLAGQVAGRCTTPLSTRPAPGPAVQGVTATAAPRPSRAQSAGFSTPPTSRATCGVLPLSSKARPRPQQNALTSAVQQLPSKPERLYE